ncbi:hypothetical protein KZ810_02715 [Sphingomonas sp. RHCKR47]|uniref:DUF6950 family protein n=1 Tax=Sphingomonas citricola TaxID=2862498 RepID=UPI001CA553C6|nr:hypothetical protein [Sphingomonas citricola]MBW6522400.1 hypothetical protein [Sphingomonas citricola]
MSELIRRRDATQATLDAVKGKPFRLGRNDCARIAAAHLRRMGHRVKLPASGSYASPRTAMKALKDRGFADLLEAMDGMGFERIAPAAALVGDVLALPTASSIGCLVVVLTNGRALGFVDDFAEASVIQPVEYAAAWRVPYAR